MAKIVVPTPTLLTVANVAEDVEELEFPIHCWWHWKIVKPF